MNVNLKSMGYKAVNGVIGVAGLRLIRLGRDFKDYIPIQETLSSAQKAGMSVGDYIDFTYNVPGSTQLTIDKMAELGVFDNGIERICEIGPGSGRYLDKTIKACNPRYYEIYETAQDWTNWLVETYGVTALPADGWSLNNTPSNSIDLVHTHKMLYAQPVLTICNYFLEMARVASDRGKLVFDIMTEECLNGEMLDNWFASGVRDPKSMISKQYAIDFFRDRGFLFNGSFLIPMLPGVTEYLVFSKNNHV